MDPLALLVTGVIGFVIGGGAFAVLLTVLGYDWTKRSNYGLTKAEPPPLWLLVVVCLVLAVVVVLTRPA